MPHVPKTGVDRGRVATAATESPPVSARFTTSLRWTLALASAAWVILVLPLVTVGMSSLRMAEVFQPDEVAAVNLLANALQHRSMRLVFDSYGHLYFNLALVPWQVWQRVGPVGGLDLLRSLRGLSFAFGWATVLISVAWATIDAGLVAATTTGILLLTSSSLLGWSTVAHPDTAQVCFLMLALYVTSQAHRDYRMGLAARASAAAGLAFACKYAGIFVLPLIAAVIVLRVEADPPDRAARTMRLVRVALAAAAGVALLLAWMAEPHAVVAALTEDGRADMSGALADLARARLLIGGGGVVALIAACVPPLWRTRSWTARATACIHDGAIALAAFGAAFVLTSPYSLRHLAFLKGLYFESNRLANGPSLVGVIQAWCSVAWSACGPALLVAAAAGAVLALGRRRSRAHGAGQVLCAWLLVYGAVLVFRVRGVEEHYLLPVVPPLALLGGFAAQDICTVRVRRLAAPAVLAALLVVAVPPYVAGRRRLADRERRSGAVAAGHWLACAVPRQARIAYDFLSYVPPEFADARPTWGGTPEWRDAVRPDVIVVNASIAAKYGADARAQHAYYACLRGGTCGFERWFANAEVQIYGRPGLRGRLAPGCDRLR